MTVVAISQISKLSDVFSSTASLQYREIAMSPIATFVRSGIVGPLEEAVREVHYCDLQSPTCDP